MRVYVRAFRPLLVMVLTIYIASGIASGNVPPPPSVLQVLVKDNNTLSLQIRPPGSGSEATNVTHYKVTVHPPDYSENFTKFQEIDTLGAMGWESFSVDGRHMLVAANYKIGEQRALQSVIYEFSTESGAFVPFQSIDTVGAYGWEAFSVGGRQMLALACHYNGNSFKTESKVYRYSMELNKFEDFQSFNTFGAGAWESFSVDGRHMLVVANYHNDITRKIESVIYEYSATLDQFKVFQKIDTLGALGWEYFSLEGRHMLALANYHDDKSHNVDSVIYEYSAASGEFEVFQHISTVGARDWESFFVDGKYMLVVANCHDADNFHVESVIYWYSSMSGKFEVFQRIETLGAFDWESFSVDGKQMLAVANYQSNTKTAMKSMIYEYSAATNKFVMFQSVDTLGAVKWKSFIVGTRHMLAVANHGHKELKSFIFAKKFSTTVTIEATNDLENAEPLVSVSDAATTQYDASAFACNSFGCSQQAISANTSPPCQSSKSFIKNGMCWLDNLCEAGYFKGLGNNKCIQMTNHTCAKGFGFHSASAFIGTPLFKGSTKNDGVCTSCPSGYTKYTAGPNACAVCTPGRYAHGSGNTNCSDCKAGKYADVPA